MELRRVLVALLLLLALASCGNVLYKAPPTTPPPHPQKTVVVPVLPPMPAPTSQPPANQPPTPTSPPSIVVTQVDLGVQPPSLAGYKCGTMVMFTYIAVFHLLPSGSGGDGVSGTIDFMYTTNNGRSSTQATATYLAGRSYTTYTFTTNGTLDVSHTYPGIAEVVVETPNSIHSPQVKPEGVCT